MRVWIPVTPRNAQELAEVLSADQRGFTARVTSATDLLKVLKEVRPRTLNRNVIIATLWETRCPKYAGQWNNHPSAVSRSRMVKLANGRAYYLGTEREKTWGHKKDYKVTELNNDRCQGCMAIRCDRIGNCRPDACPYQVERLLAGVGNDPIFYGTFRQTG